ncbi:MAG: AAA family ATPase [Planctomycetaceae bacterium]|nr:AAA family ATPase [Planctomycetaceae bacterium]
MKKDELELLIRAKNPIISIETPDEPRAVRVVREVVGKMSRPLAEWSVTEGLVTAPPAARSELVKPGAILPALRYVRDSSYPIVYLFKDISPLCADAQVARFLRDLYFSPDSRLWTLILVDSRGLPPDSRRLTVPFDVGWPDEEEMKQVVQEALSRAADQNMTEISVKLSGRQMDQLVQMLRGLTASEASRLVAAAVHDDKLLDANDLNRVMDAKRNRLSTQGCLETMVADIAPEDIGGLANLKKWLNQRRGGFSPAARKFGLDPPRGILLLGVQGCGKSLCAKVVASAWKMPLLRMDPGVLYQKFIGESEARLREALAQAESLAPVVLWIDEIEKAFASAGSNSADGGLSQRMFGTLLSWMQDHRHPIFMIATANNISDLPPELMRKGRFDEIFFIDLPRERYRKTIFTIHLRRRGRDKEQFDLDRLSKATEGFTGAEIEQAILSGMYAAYAESEEFATEHILEAIEKTRPLSVVMHESIQSLRVWAANRCVPAD